MIKNGYFSSTKTLNVTLDLVKIKLILALWVKHDFKQKLLRQFQVCPKATRYYVKEQHQCQKDPSIKEHFRDVVELKRIIYHHSNCMMQAYQIYPINLNFFDHFFRQFWWRQWIQILI